MKRRYYVYILALASLGMLLTSFWHVIKVDQILPSLAPPAPPVRTPYGHAIAATGIVEPQSENIVVGSALSGVVTELYVPASKVGQKVRQGDPLFRVDDRHLKTQLTVAQAKVAAAQAQLKRLQRLPRPETIPPSEAKVRSSKATAARAEDDYKRAQQLFKRGVATEQELITRQLSYQAAMQQAAESVAEHALLQAGAWDADKEIAQTAVTQAAAEVDTIRTELERTLVRSPVDGEVLQVNLRLGEYVAAQPNQPLIVLGDMQRRHLRASLDEHDIPRFRPTAPAIATPRGAPQQKIPLRFVRVEPIVVPKRSLTGDNTERIDTRVLQVLYAVEGDATLYVGQQFDVYIDVGPRD